MQRRTRSEVSDDDEGDDATVVVAAKTVSVASNTAVRCGLATPSCSTRA